MTLLGLSVNLDERGTYFADVRDANGNTVFEIHSNEDGGIDLIEDGFMKHKDDLDGLTEHLQNVLGDANIEVVPLIEQERRIGL